MARPRDTDPAETRARILDSATALFAARGVDGTPLRAVAKASGLSLATLTHHFGNKAGLYEAALERVQEQIAEVATVLAEGLAEGQPTRDVIEAAIRSAFRFACAHAPIIRLTTRAEAAGGVIPRHLEPILGPGAEMLSVMTGVPVLTCRLTTASLQFLVARYAVIPTDVLAETLRVPGLDTDATGLTPAQRAVEDHLVQIAWRILVAPPADV